MKPSTTAMLQIHFCVLLWGFTAILGKLISLAALPLVWWRMLIVVAALLCVPRVVRSLRALPARLWLAYAGVGGLVALHWLTPAELKQKSSMHRSPLVQQCLDDYLAGKNFPIEVLSKTHA